MHVSPRVFFKNPSPLCLPPAHELAAAVRIARDHATGPRLITELRSTPSKSIGGPSLAPANVVAVMTAVTAGARLTSAASGAGVSCTGRATDDWPTAAAAVVVTTAAGVDSMGSAMDEAPAAGAVDVVTAGAAETDDVVSTAAEVLLAVVLESSTGSDELDDGGAATLDVLESTTAELDDGTDTTADVLVSAAAESEDETTTALDVLGSTTVDREVGSAFSGTEDVSEGRETTAIQFQC